MKAFYSLSALTLSSLAAGFPLRIRQANPPDVGFAADSSIDVVAIYNAVKSSQSNSLAKYRSQPDKPESVDIYGDWQDLGDVSAMHFTADMDVDCDGVDYKCSGNPDGQPQTSFGHLSATKVPYFVIPDDFATKHSVQKNALGAIICDGKMYYGIMGDTNGDSPFVIGEASMLMAQTCFPSEDVSGNRGHGKEDVAYIMFPTVAPTGVNDETIDITSLKQLGDAQIKLLQAAISGGGRKSTGGSSELPQERTENSPTATLLGGASQGVPPTSSAPPDSDSSTAVPQHSSTSEVPEPDAEDSTEEE